jgi:predicted Zn-dependent peptidase
MSVRLHTLPNGLRVICDPMPGLKTLALTVAVEGGARWEDQARSGWSHLLEHLVFKGAGDMSAREIVERIEGRGGSINAATGQERTSFEVRGMDGSLPLSMQVVSDLLFRPTLDPAEIEREKDVVAQEIAEAFDTPDDHVFEMAQARAFADQPLGRPILGSVDSIGTATRETMADWRARLYAPDRMVVAVSGAVREDELLDLAGQWFGGAASAVVDTPGPAQFVGGEARLTRRIEQANLVFLLPALSSTDPAVPILRVLVEILGGGMASRLFQSAREDRGLAYAIDAYFETYADTGVVGIYAGAAPERAEALAGVVADEIRALAQTGPTAAEVSRAQAVLSASLWMSDESPVSRSGRLAGQTLTFGAPLASSAQADAIAAVTVEQVQALAARLLASGRAASAVLGPKLAQSAGRRFADAVTP